MSPPEPRRRPAGKPDGQGLGDDHNQRTPATAGLRAGAARRDEGMQLSLDALQPAWRSVAEDVLDDLVASGHPFTTDDLRDRTGDPTGTGSARALGGMIAGRFRKGQIRAVGFSTSRQPQRHGGVLRIWQGVRS